MMLTAESVARIKDAASRYPIVKSAVLPALTIAYRQVGHLNEDIYDEIGEVLGVPAGEVAEAASFYTMFPKQPVGKHLIQVCHNISCSLLGAESLISYLEQKLGVQVGETTPDNLFTVVRVECLGSCATAPMMQINHDYYENLTRKKVDRIIEQITTDAGTGGAGVSFYSPVRTNAVEVAASSRLHLFKYVEDPEQPKIDTYEAHGGYRAWRKALTSMTADQVTAEVKTSGLRGRGGAGFPAGMKWGFIPKGTTKPRYLVCNADESEPGTCKDRVLMERDPHAVIEGMAIASYAIGCHLMFIYIRGEFGYSTEVMQTAMAEAYRKGHLGKDIYGTGYDLEMIVHTGGGAYICGEETALLNSLEGKRGNARIKPPFPAIAGLYDCPTIINNVETLATVPHVLNRGAEWYKSLGTERSTGTKIFSLSGHVNQPGNYELVLGHNLKDLIYSPQYGGGILSGKKLKGVIPGGSSTPFLTQEMIDIPLDYESLAAAGSMLGSGAVIVFHEETCIVWAIANLIRFYRHESCGKCTPCRDGTSWLEQIIHSIERGTGRPGDVEKIESICENILGRTVCPLGDAAVMPIMSAVKLWRDEWQYHIDHGKCLVSTKFDLAEGN